MNRVCVLLMGCVLFAVASVGAGPSEDYVWVYSLIQQGESREKAGRDAQALAAYLDAQKQLVGIKRRYPTWNPKVVDYRLRLLEQKIAALKPAEAVPAAAVEPRSGEPQPTGESSPVVPALNAEIQDLKRDLEQLHTENSLLQAKLQEALAVRPAATNPQALEKAEEQNRTLSKEVEILRSQLAEERTGSGGTADAQAVEDLREALVQQTQRADDLEADRESLAMQVAALTSRAQGSETLRQENALLRQQVEQLRNRSSVQDAGGGAGLDEVMAELALLQSEADILRLEKAALEDRLVDLRSRAATPSPTVSAQLQESQARVTKLEQERSRLQQQLVQANQDLTNLNAASFGEPTGAVQAEIKRLQARLAVYEAEKIPYSTEELVLFRMSQEPDLAGAPRPSPPPGIGALVAQAETQFREGDYEHAEATLREMLAKDESNAYTLANLAATQIEQGKETEAEANLRKALAIAPEDPFTLMTMGMLKLRQEDYESALDYLGQAAQYNPDSAVLQNYLGVALNEQGMRGPAETALRRAIQLRPGFADAHFNLALVYALQDPPLQALARWHYQKALGAGHPRSPQVEQLLDRPAAN